MSGTAKAVVGVVVIVGVVVGVLLISRRKASASTTPRLPGGEGEAPSDLVFRGKILKGMGGLLRSPDAKGNMPPSSMNDVSPTKQTMAAGDPSLGTLLGTKKTWK